MGNRRVKAYALPQRVLREMITTGNLLTHGTVIVEEGMPNDAEFLGFGFEFNGHYFDSSYSDEALLLAYFQHPSFEEVPAGVQPPTVPIILRRLPIEVPGPDTKLVRVFPTGPWCFPRPQDSRWTICGMPAENPAEVATLRDVLYHQDICPECWPWRKEAGT